MIHYSCLDLFPDGSMHVCVQFLALKHQNSSIRQGHSSNFYGGFGKQFSKEPGDQYHIVRTRRMRNHPTSILPKPQGQLEYFNVMSFVKKFNLQEQDKAIGNTSNFFEMLGTLSRCTAPQADFGDIKKNRQEMNLGNHGLSVVQIREKRPRSQYPNHKKNQTAIAQTASIQQIQNAIFSTRKILRSLENLEHARSHCFHA